MPHASPVAGRHHLRTRTPHHFSRRTRIFIKCSDGDAYDHTVGLGYNLIRGDEVRRRGVSDVLREVRETVAGRPVYLCFDMDYIDPSAAPGVATPTWGGPDSAAAFELLQELQASESCPQTSIQLAHHTTSAA